MYHIYERAESRKVLVFTINLPSTLIWPRDTLPQSRGHVSARSRDQWCSLFGAPKLECGISVLAVTPSESRAEFPTKNLAREVGLAKGEPFFPRVQFASHW